MQLIAIAQRCPGYRVGARASPAAAPTRKAGARAAAASAAWAQAALELDHADRIATRILELGGEPDLDPDRLSARSHAMYRPRPRSGGAGDADESGAERIAIETYREMLAFVGHHDPTTRRLLEDVLALEEAHLRQARAQRA
jgi:bacterioferritin